VYENGKAEINIAEDLAHRRFEKFWAQEEVWIRKGVEARRTRNEGRGEAPRTSARRRAARRERIGQIKLSLDSGERSGKLVASSRT
jgi:ATP-binding cassette subfamily F protein uup